MWHSVAEPGTALRATDFCSRVCVHRLARSVVESCPLLHMSACARALANFIIRTHTRVTQEMKNLTRSACILQRAQRIHSLRRYERVEHVLGSRTASPPQTCSLTSITFQLGCCSRPLHTGVGAVLYEIIIAFSVAVHTHITHVLCYVGVQQSVWVCLSEK